VPTGRDIEPNNCAGPVSTGAALLAKTLGLLDRVGDRDVLATPATECPCGIVGRVKPVPPCPGFDGVRIRGVRGRVPPGSDIITICGKAIDIPVSGSGSGSDSRVRGDVARFTVAAGATLARHKINSFVVGKLVINTIARPWFGANLTNCIHFKILLWYVLGTRVPRWVDYRMPVLVYYQAE